MLWIPTDKQTSSVSLGVVVECKIEYLPNYNKDWGPVGYAHKGDSGMDLRAAVERPLFMEPGDTVVVPTGIKTAIRRGTELQIRSRSGLASKTGVFVLNSPGTVDSSWRGEIGVILHNASNRPFVVSPGDRVAQMVLAPVYTAEFSEAVVSDIPSDRGENGFGSTGV